MLKKNYFYRVGGILFFIFFNTYVFLFRPKTYYPIEEMYMYNCIFLSNWEKNMHHIFILASFEKLSFKNLVLLHSSLNMETETQNVNLMLFF